MDQNVIENENAGYVNRDSGSEEIQQEPLPIGEETIFSGEEGIIQARPPPEQRSSETTVDRNDVCCCASGKTLVTSESSGAEQARCPLCGKIIVVEESNNISSGLQFSGSGVAPSAGGTVRLGNLLGQALTNRLNFVPNTPNTSLQQHNSTIESGRITTAQQVHSLREKTPVHDDWHSSVLMPPEPAMFHVFVTVQSTPGTNVQLVSVYFVTQEHFQEEGFCRWMEQMKPHVVAIGDEYLSQEENQHVHTVNIDNHVTIKFEFIKQLHRKFRIMGAPIIEVPLIRINSLNKHRIFGSVAAIMVESLAAEPGEICQDHLRMTLECGNTMKMLIPIWCSGQP